MQVEHIGVNGRVRRTFENVSGMYIHEGNSIVSIMRSSVSQSSSAAFYTYEFPIALIHLAEGESVERVEEDEPTRS